jgi:acetylornithine deacetylase
VTARLYGRGSTDMKGYVACLPRGPFRHADREAEEAAASRVSRMTREVGCSRGARHDREDPRAPGAPIACFVGEPTEMDVVIGHKAKRSFKVIVHGRTCHSSLAPLGVNAWNMRRA